MFIEIIKRIALLFGFILIMALTWSWAVAETIPGESRRLTGVIKKIDYKHRQVVVQVLSKGCTGEKTFAVDDMTRLFAAEGDKITFFSDSARCPGATGHKMIPQGRK